MHRSHRRLFGFVCTATIAASACITNAQLGPNPGEVPAIPAIDESQTIAEPSKSESVRPAIDELLLNAADRFVRESGQPTSDSSVSPQLPSITEPVDAIDASFSSGLAQDFNTELEPQSAAVPPAKPIGQPATRSVLIGPREPAPGSASAKGGYLQTIIALLGVVLLILGLGQVYKRLARSQGGLVGQLGAGGIAPSGIIEVVGRYPISKGMTLVVLKFDRRILLLAHATPTKSKGGQGASMQVLSELTDAEDIASILLKARSASGDSIAQSFERTLREADELTDEYLHEVDLGVSEVNPVRFPTRNAQPARTISNDEGDRAELWSSGQDSQAAAGVLRRRLASMRREQHG